MASSLKTIKKAKLARTSFGLGKDESIIAKNLDVSIERVKEYLERNEHPLSCRICGGYGVNKQRSTGMKKAICL